jgi:GntR family transcriptional regulator/MocR family aminotransferase
VARRRESRISASRLDGELDTVKVHFGEDFLDQLSRRTNAPELLVELERGRNRGSLSAQLERELRHAVRSGRLRPNAQLPSTRALAAELGISRGLVVAAYAQLGAEGYLRLRRNAPPLVADAIGAKPRPRTLAADPSWPYNLRPDLPDYGAFPREEWLTSYRAALKAAPDRELAYGDVRGVAALRDELATYLGRVRGVVADLERLFVCGGFAQRSVCSAGSSRAPAVAGSRSRIPATPSSASSSRAAAPSRCRSRSTARASTSRCSSGRRPTRCS